VIRTASGRAECAAAVGALVVGAAAALLAASRPWQVITAARPRPLADQIIRVTGRSLEPVVPALALVALAGAVAVLATRGLLRRIVGALLAVAGGVVIWRAFAGVDSVSAVRAVSLLRDRSSGVGVVLEGQQVRIVVDWWWPVIAVAAGVLVMVAGALVAWRGATWTGLSGRYDVPGAPPSGAGAPPDATLWTALDRGEDPTARTES
jgi:uncharacterized membrane protein (TIGR02234 family)